MFKRIAAAAIVSAAFLSAPAVAGDQDFKLINRTGYQIDKVFVSPHNVKSWQEDVLGEDVLENGGNVDITFSRSEDTCNWDIKAIYEDGDVAVWTNGFNLCEVSEITVKYNAQTGVTSAASK